MNFILARKKGQRVTGQPTQISFLPFDLDLGPDGELRGAFPQLLVSLFPLH